MCHPVRVVYAVELVENVLTHGGRVYTIIAIGMFALFSQLLVVFYEKAAFAIKFRSWTLLDEKMGFTLESHRTLVGAVERLMERFGWILMANTCFTALSLFYNLYYIIEFVHDRYWLAALSISFDFCCATFRLCLGCHSAECRLDYEKGRKLFNRL